MERFAWKQQQLRVSSARGKRRVSLSPGRCEMWTPVSSGGVLDTLVPLTSPSDALLPHPRHRSHYFVARASPTLKQPFEALQTRHLLLPLPHSAASLARGRHLGWQERLRAKKHLERAGLMSGGRPVMSPLNVWRGARNIKCRPYRLALASHNLCRGQGVKAIHNSSARPPRSLQVVQHGGPFKAACVRRMWLHVLWENVCVYMCVGVCMYIQALMKSSFRCCSVSDYQMTQPFYFSPQCKTFVQGGCFFLQRNLFSWLMMKRKRWNFLFQLQWFCVW